jgi:hypothetical protein
MGEIAWLFNLKTDPKRCISKTNENERIISLNWVFIASYWGSQQSCQWQQPVLLQAV